MPSTSSTVTGRLMPPPGAASLVDLPAAGSAFQNSEHLLDVLKSGLSDADDQLAHRFWNDEAVETLVSSRAWVVEQFLILAWNQLMPQDRSVSLVAVGGFGRGELHPHSDVDLMILLGATGPDDRLKASIEAFFTLLWDAGLLLGHSVRTLAQCEEEARADVVTVTNLMESRVLAGNTSLFTEMKSANAPGRVWPGPAFFDAKYTEQVARHARFHDTAYNLEPNIKEGPGGLRDIQMISWVSKRHLGADSLHGLVEHGFLTETEFADLHAGQVFLWRVRFALHLLAGRAEDRLLFDHQRQIAAALGYGEMCNSNAAVEKFMQQYYRVVMQLERLNERLLQLFQEELLVTADAPGENLGADFMVQNGYLGVRDEALFEQRPEAMMEMFVLLAQHPEIMGVRASAIRLIGGRVQQLDHRFQEQPEVLAAFYQLLRQPGGVYTQLQRMNRYGLLAALLPPFARITGRMQFDLFHVYTVDQHILFVVRNLRRFAYGKYAESFPHTAGIFRQTEKPELLYLAALFHDIAKGRGGDHSRLGAEDALEFCRKLALPEDESEQVAWLVRHHLLMSQTAQRKDITDPDIVVGFARTVGSQRRLDQLYLLTVADIAATSPKLWNSWKDGLLWALYTATCACLEAGFEAPVDPSAHQESARHDAMAALLESGFSKGEVLSLWKHLPASAFQRFSTGQMQWATACVVASPADEPVVIAIRTRPELGISEVLVSAQDYTGLFAATTSVFDDMGLNVLSARVITTRNERSFDLFQLMSGQGLPLNSHDSDSLVERLHAVLGRQQLIDPVRRKLPRRLRPFASAPHISFDSARGGTVTALEIECTDRPGLLSQLAAAMVAGDIRIHDAMIATFGERVEDTFLVTDIQDRPLDKKKRAQLVKAINRKLQTS